MINIQAHGKYTQPVKVLSVESVHEKVNQVKVEGLTFPLKVWKSQESKFGTKLEAGAQAEARLISLPGTDRRPRYVTRAYMVVKPKMMIPKAIVIVPKISKA